MKVQSALLLGILLPGATTAFAPAVRSFTTRTIVPTSSSSSNVAPRHIAKVDSFNVAYPPLMPLSTTSLSMTVSSCYDSITNMNI